MDIRYNASLKSLNTFGIEAKAKALATFGNADELKALLGMEEFSQMPMLVLGGGSNLLFTSDFPGLVLLNRVMGIAHIGQDDTSHYVRVGAGENWHLFVMHCLDRGWYGLENLSLIPGNVGASPMQNIGAYGVEIKERFESLEAYHLESGRVDTFDGKACEFGYRESVFKRKFKGQYIILSVTYKLLKKSQPDMRYGAISQELEAMGITAPSSADVSRAVINIRNSKLPNPAVLGNAGSFFKNPVVPIEVMEAIRSQYEDVPSYPAESGHVKLAAGWLIEKAGWKGVRKGPCGVHEKQALVIVNYGGATGKEIYDLSEDVLQSVKERFGVELEREVNII